MRTTSVSELSPNFEGVNVIYSLSKIVTLFFQSSLVLADRQQLSLSLFEAARQLIDNLQRHTFALAPERFSFTQGLFIQKKKKDTFIFEAHLLKFQNLKC